jgi:16S rRNA A1518/A1519 N6-dimethyltransferase RsmA/KsgA/DIM1 with predicted DNA glycosylase/AP lyase activity
MKEIIKKSKIQTYFQVFIHQFSEISQDSFRSRRKIHRNFVNYIREVNDSNKLSKNRKMKAEEKNVKKTLEFCNYDLHPNNAIKSSCNY